MTERKYDHNTRVIFVDSQGVQHEALVTAWWGTGPQPTPDMPAGFSTGEVFESPNYGRSVYGDGKEPGCNLLYISKDKAKHDNYGRQLERSTSVVHKSQQTAPANFWCWPEELT